MQSTKVSTFITQLREAATDYRETIGEMKELADKWSSLYSTLVEEDSFVGENADVVASGTQGQETRTESVTTVVSNFLTLTSQFDTGYDTNFDRVTM